MPSETPPPIQTWWPHLSISARHRVLGSPDSPLDEQVCAEIERLTGVDAPGEWRLSDTDRQFVAHQTETVD